MDIAEFADLFTTRMESHLDKIEQDAIDAANAPVVTRVSDVPAQPLPWLWNGWIPSGTITILGGHVGEGKSTVVAALIAALTSGNPLPDGTTTDPVNVLILSAEDDPARVLRPRLAANDADLTRVFHMPPIDIRHEADRLRHIIDTHDIGLVVIDSLGGVLRRADRASEGEIRDSLNPLIDVIAGTSVAVLGVMRVGKSTRIRPAQRLVGSSAVPAIARSVIMVARDDNHADENETAEPGRAVLQVVKSNYATAPAPVALRMDTDSRVHWLGPVDTGIDERAGDGLDRRLSRSERADATDFLREFLREEDIEANQVLKQAKRLGFSEITIRRAKKDLGIVSHRKPPSYGAWKWHLPTGQEGDHTRRGK